MFAYCFFMVLSGTLTLAKAICGEENKKCVETVYYSTWFALFGLCVASISALFVSMQASLIMSIVFGLLVGALYITGQLKKDSYKL